MIVPLLLAAAVSATDPAAMAGPYYVGGVSEGDDSCDVKLRKDAVIGGYGLDIKPKCARTIGLQDAYSWRFGANGAIEFADAERHTIITFEKGDDDWFASDRGLMLARDDPDAAPPTYAGAWEISDADGKVMCKLTFTADKGEKSGKASVSGPCSAPYAGLGIANWRTFYEQNTDKIELRSAAGKRVLVMEQIEPMTYRKGYGATSVYLGRPANY